MKRRTVSFDDDNYSKIQKLRAERLMTTTKDYSFTSCINDLLRYALRNRHK